MTGVLLATYPEVFAGGAIIAGLPYGSAHTLPEAFDRMRGHGSPREQELGALVRQASERDGRPLFLRKACFVSHCFPPPHVSSELLRPLADRPWSSLLRPYKP